MKLEEIITEYEIKVEEGRAQWLDWEEDSQSLTFEGAGSHFGHTDDCFDSGEEYGAYLEAKNILIKLKGLK